MKLISSIKHQALALFVSFTFGLTLLYLGLAVVVAFVVEDNLIYRLLKNEATHIEQTYAETGTLTASSLSFIEVYKDSAALPEFAQQAILEGTSDNEIFSPTSEHYHFKKLYLAGGQTGYLLAEVSPLLVVTENPRIFELFLFGLILNLGIAFYLATKVTSYTIKPVMAMVEAVKQKTTLPKFPYELGYLSNTLQQAFDSLSNTLKREKDFTTDVSHELRTPITVLTNMAQLAQNRGLEKEDIKQLAEVAGQMHHTVEVLLALARAESLTQQTCFVKPELEQACMSCLAAIGDKQAEFEFVLNVADDYTLETNPSLLNLLFVNLINNAINHSSNQQLVVTLEHSTLEFCNHVEQVNNMDESILLPGVKRENSMGVGQGLYLVTRILENLGWEYQVIQSNSKFSVQISL